MIDLAKNVCAIHGVDEHGEAVLVRPSVVHARLHQLVAALPPCTIGMEACSGAHHWARLFAQHGHTVRLDERVAEFDRHVIGMASEDARSRALMQLSGIGSTTASALVATIGNARLQERWSARRVVRPGARAIQLRR
jgi:transposase